MSDPTHDKETLRERAERAERALEEFRTRVRNAVITEAEQRDWCEDVDGWLDDLGLPSRYGDLPREQSAVVLLTDGRVAVRHDDDNEPWRTYDPRPTTDHPHYFGNAWHTDAAIAQLYARTLEPVGISARERA